MAHRTFRMALALLVGGALAVAWLLLSHTWAPARASPVLTSLPGSSPMIWGITPSSAPNDLDTSITITGTSFVNGATALLGDAPLRDVRWVSATTLRAIVPWGLEPGVYTMTVVNPGGISGTLPNAFTVTQGIGVWTTGGPYGGEVQQIEIHPLTPTILYARVFDVGVFRSRDGGENWEYIFADRNTTGLAIDPFRPNTVYANHGQQGFYRSDDSGDNWTPIPFPSGIWPNDGTPSFYRIYAHPTQPGTLFAVGWSVYDNPFPSGGVVKSPDYGKSWVRAMTGLTDTQVVALAFHPTQPLTVYLATESGNIFLSTDGGESWQYAARPVGPRLTSLAVNPFGTHEVWVSNDSRAIMKSTNAALTAWLPVNLPPNEENLHTNTIVFSPVTSGTVWLGNGGGSGLLVSTDGGAHWNGALRGVCVNAITFSPTEPGTIYLGDIRYGIWKTTNNGETWDVHNHGLTALIPEELATVPTRPGRVYALHFTWPGIFFSDSGGGSWKFIHAGEGRTAPAASVLVDPFALNRVYLGMNWPVSDEHTGHRPLYISEDGGLNWSKYGILDSPSEYEACWGVFGVIRASPRVPGELLGGVYYVCRGSNDIPGHIYRSTDRGEHWELVTAGQELEWIMDIAYDPVDPAIAYAATNGSGILKSTDGGHTWRPLTAGFEPLQYVNNLAVEPVPPYRLFANGRGLYVSSDRGLTWSLAGDPLWGIQVEDLLFVSDILYAATTTGLLQSEDGAQSWQRAVGSIGYVNVRSLAATITYDGRLVLYAGVAGGMVSSMSQASNGRLNGSALVNAGVYRFTTLLYHHRLYLPLVSKGRSP